MRNKNIPTPEEFVAELSEIFKPNFSAVTVNFSKERVDETRKRYIEETKVFRTKEELDTDYWLKVVWLIEDLAERRYETLYDSWRMIANEKNSDKGATSLDQHQDPGN